MVPDVNSPCSLTFSSVGASPSIKRCLVRKSAAVVCLAKPRTPAGAAWYAARRVRPTVSAKIKLKIRPPVGEAYTRIENSRGEVGFYLVSDGKDMAYRNKCRSPSFHNIHVLPEIARGHMVADLIAIIGSMDIVLGEVDR